MIDERVLYNILFFVSVSYKINISALINKSQELAIVAPRQTYCKLAKDLTKASLNEIGGIIHQDHATVHHAIKVMNNYVTTKHKYGMNYLMLFLPCKKIIEMTDELIKNTNYGLINFSILNGYLYSRFTTDEVTDIIKKIQIIL